MNPNQPQPPGGMPDNAAQNQQAVPTVPAAPQANSGPVGQPGIATPAPGPVTSGGKNGQKAPSGVTTTQVQTKNPNSTQNTLLIKEIRDGIAFMSDGSMRAAVACRSINFDLMSSREREGVEYAYQNFLNSLYFPVQVLIRSQKVDIGPYLERLAKLRREQDNMLLGVLMDDYMTFIESISEETNIMDKQFYIIVPYYPAGDPTSAVTSSKNLFAGLFGSSKQSVVHIQEEAFRKAKDELQNRILSVTNGMMQMGVQATRLNTQQFSELLYNFYNPDTAVREPIGNFDPRPAVAVRKGQGEAPRPYVDRDI